MGRGLFLSGKLPSCVASSNCFLKAPAFFEAAFISLLIANFYPLLRVLKALVSSGEDYPGL